MENNSIYDVGFDGGVSFRVGDTLHDFNKTIVTVSYTINGETEFNQVTFEKSDFKPNS
ncbi:hypothetical protein [uncultured Methanobrevibacter sp.]|uniref:hypothetical protein n=1 Tax=uncultured Methanobrevibacter sp. TaxID=253161 RepID=UPI002600B1BC|nr:hypothetical protein [uncultured Methanobrevibacter sp.]